MTHTFVAMYYQHFQHDQNIDQMYSSDLLWWIIQAIDNRLTGEHNGSVERMKNPKAKPKIPKAFNTFGGESFFRRSGVMPARWEKAFQKMAENKAEMVVEKKPVEGSIFTRLRKLREEREAVEKMKAGLDKS